jgi:deoxyribodipyrimidine photo-lyase
MTSRQADSTGAGGQLSSRVLALNEGPLRQDGAYVLYWMVAHRRLGWNHALDRAVHHARMLSRPLVILEALRADYPWSSDRHHGFALDGMREHARALEGSPVLYHPYVEASPGEGAGLLEAWAARASVVVTDSYPAFFIPRMQQAAARRLEVRVEAVDANGLLPLSATTGPFSAAYPFRRFLQRTLAPHLVELPHPDPLPLSDLPSAGAVGAEVLARWPVASTELLAATPEVLARLPIDHTVGRTALPGGTEAGRHRLDAFIRDGLERYGEERNHPDAGASSRLSPWLHWGHLSAHEVFHRVVEHQGWSPGRLSTVADGARHGWWGLSSSAESFLDELVTWRELGFCYCYHERAYDRWETLPEWARNTLEDHASDARPWSYTPEELDAAATHDEIWNAAQRELREEGVMHNYLRMLWGKKILEWSQHPRDALDVMIDLNNRYALDGRDPNSYTGIMWVLGRFDRGWPERPVYGKVRSMSSEATRRKVRLDRYLSRWGDPSGEGSPG